MAVDAVNGINETTPSTTVENGGSPGSRNYNNMTAREILDAEKAGETVPAEILTWAKENPDSKETYGNVQGETGDETSEADTVSYRESMEEQGMSLKQMCKQFTQMSSQKENRDLQNVTKMAPYIPQVPTDEQNGNDATSEVQVAMDEITKEILNKDNWKLKGFSFKNDGLKFFQALKQGNSGELNYIDDSLESIQNVLNEAISGAKDSKQCGNEAIQTGQEYKSSLRRIRFLARRVANKAIEQGENTVKMAERTDKLAQAIAKDNNVALKNTKDNITAVEEAEIPGVEQGENESTGGIASGNTTNTSTGNQA